MRLYTPIQFLLLVLCLGTLSHCAKIEDVTLGNSNEILGVSVVDTFTVDVSTLLLDALPTGAQGRLLIGQLSDGFTGDISSSSYFRMVAPTFSVEEFPNDIQFDSLTVKLFYDGYSYGDTTAQMTLDVFRLDADIEPRELSKTLEDDEYPVFVSGDALYADQSFAYQAEALGSATFFPKPQSTTDTIHMRFPDELGQTFLQMMMNNDTRISIQDEFVSFFKGLAIVPKNGAKCMIGLRDSVVMDLHYSYERQSDGKRVEATKQFTMGATNYQYNKIGADRSNSALAAINYTDYNLSSGKTAGRAFIQGGTGLVARLRFPNLRQELNSTSKIISKAELVIETDQSEFGYDKIPTSLVLLRANKYGTPTSLLSTSSGSSVQATYQQASESGGVGRGSYIFNMTDYISSLKSSLKYNEDESVLVSIPTTDLLSTFNSLRIAGDGEKPRIKLNIVYINY